MSEQQMIDENTVPLPPMRPLSPKKRLPPPHLLEAVGPLLAYHIHNYNEEGPICRYLDLYTGKTKTAIAGPDANLFVTRHARDYFSVRRYRHDQNEELGSHKYLVGMDGEEHYHLRKLQKQGYSRSVLDGRYAEMVEIVRQQAAQWEPGQTLSINPHMRQIVVAQLGATILNHPTPERWEDICSYIDSMLTASFAAHFMDEEKRVVYEAAKAGIMDLADEILDAHRTTPARPPRPDLVDDLITAVGQDKNLLAPQDLRVSTLTPYIAGINPVSHTCTFMLHALLAHPHILAPIIAEIDEAFASEDPSPQMLRKMTRLRYAMQETLRMFPFAPVLEMTSTQGFEFAGYRVEPHVPVVVATTVAHFLPELYPDPFTFDIERYTPERGEHRQAGAFAAYGVGPHICLGAGYAEEQMMLIMATLLHTVQLEIAPESPKPVVGLRSKNSFSARVMNQR